MSNGYYTTKWLERERERREKLVFRASVAAMLIAMFGIMLLDGMVM